MTTEKKAAASEKARVSVEKRFSNLEAKLRETKLKLAEAASLNTVRVEELVDLKVALKGYESKWYDEGFANTENSVEPVINKARKLAFKEAAQKIPGVADEEETTSLRELVEQIDAHAEPIDLEATSNPNVEDQPGRNVQPPNDTQHAPEDVARFQFVDPSY